jgi:hypothetical protein
VSWQTHAATEKCEANDGRVGHVLSRNLYFHVYKEQDEDFLLSLVRECVQGSDGGDDIPQAVLENIYKKAQPKHTAYGEIFATAPVAHMLTKLFQFSDYYFKTRLFKPFLLVDKVIKPQHGAVSRKSIDASKVLTNPDSSLRIWW